LLHSSAQSNPDCKDCLCVRVPRADEADS
jgi:hypothetical protein